MFCAFIPRIKYCMSFQLYNMQNDLHITDTQYLIALTVFFFPYSLFEVCFRPL